MTYNPVVDAMRIDNTMYYKTCMTSGIMYTGNLFLSQHEVTGLGL